MIRRVSKTLSRVTTSSSSSSSRYHRRSGILAGCLPLFLIASFASPIAQSFAFQQAAAVSASSSTTCRSMTSDATTTSSRLDKPFGAWKSPITSQAITKGSVGIGGLTVIRNAEQDDKVYWLEGRPLEGGRNVLCQYDASNEEAKYVSEITPKETNVRTRVHEYGGAATTVAKAEGIVFYSDFMTQQVFSLSLDNDGGDEPTKVTTGPPGQYRYANGLYDASRKALICVREDHGPEGKASPQDVVNTLVAIEVATGTEVVLLQGYDFAAAPTLSADGTTLAGIVWDHPNMPWDATRLVTVTLAEGNLFDAETTPASEPVVVAGADGDTSVLQPVYHSTGSVERLLYLSDESGYHNLYAFADGKSHPVLPMEVDFGGRAPGWMLGQMGYSELEDGRLAAVISKEGDSVLLVLDLEGWDASKGPLPSEKVVEYTSRDGLPRMFGSVAAGSHGDLYFLGGDSSTPSSVYKWNLNEKNSAEILKTSSSIRFDPSVISVPKQIEFPTTLGTAFGYYYAPKNGGYECTTDQAPPLLVKAHGGPTACTGISFNAGIQYWTSRGFAVLDVDYGGSTGYGRDYRRRLRGSWGIVDIDDVCNGAKYLVDQGLADGDRLCIDGGSAGGYTTLGALAFRDVFKAGCSLYGVADLTALAADTHKFESRYLDGLIGKYPEDKEIYETRSPISSVDTLNCPILLLQGDEDKIVPPNQAEKMHEALLSKGIPTCLKIYEGEQHGFRKSENIEDALDSELSFYGKVFGIDVPDAIDLSIDNL